MAIAQVKSATGNGASVTINGVTAGNLLVIQTGWYKFVGGAYTETAPTDSNGTVSSAVRVASSTFGASDNAGTSICYVQNTNSGSHQITTDSTVGSHHTTITEFSGLLTAAALDVTANGATNSTAHTSRTTGTTATTAQADELVIIGHAMGAAVGVADVGYTDPVSGFTTLQRVSNDSTDIAMFHAYKIISATGTQSATFNWTASEAAMGSQGVIATFKAVVASYTLMGQACL